MQETASILNSDENDGPDAVHRMVVGRHELKKYVVQQEVNATFRDG